MDSQPEVGNQKPTGGWEPETRTEFGQQKNKFRRVGRSEAETHLPAKWWVSLRSTHPTFDPF